MVVCIPQGTRLDNIFENPEQKRPQNSFIPTLTRSVNFLSILEGYKGKRHFPLFGDQLYPGPVPFGLRGAGR